MAADLGKVRWGVLGYARIAHQSVIPAILRSGNSTLHALASRDEAKLAESRARFPGGHRTYRGYAALLDDPEVEAVYIPLPNAQHREWTIRAAERGKHVLCEKPIALNAAECREMIAACAAHGVKLMEAFMYRYTDRTRQVIAVLRSGVLGEIKFVEACFRYPLTNPASIKLRPELGGGALYDVGCYAVNFAGLVADLAAGVAPGGAAPASVSVECVRRGGIDEILSALLRYPSGLIAAAHCGFNAQKRIRAEIVGTRGALTVPETFFDNAGTLTLTLGEETREIPVALGDRYRGEIEDFADAIRQDRAPGFPLAETLRNAEVLDRLLRKSAEMGS
ncbi:MAG: Gfo/Idh/MocA family oxidoreductase [Opitutaceae bacterium]|nr:Gfo/Idh/MocA family oxidoreductase [Opitutaceae bacterium]